MKTDGSEILSELLQKYRGKGLLLDTNLLLLYLVGAVHPARVATFKPIANQGFLRQDFDLLLRIAGSFKKMVTTPHILTEVSNHSVKLKRDEGITFCRVIGALLKNWDERYTESALLCQREEFQKIGLTDTAIGETAAGRCLVMTVDFELAGHLQKRKVDVINFNHLRFLN